MSLEHNFTYHIHKKNDNKIKDKPLKIIIGTIQDYIKRKFKR